MGARADHHVALRVSEMDRAIRFWEEALGARVVSAPSLREGPFIESVFGEGTRVTVAHVAFDANALELWEFHEPAHPIPPADQAVLGQMHFAVTVDDVPASVARVEAAGGRTRFPVKQLAGGDSSAQFVYCEDPDGNVFELLSRSHPDTVAIINARQGT